MDNALTAIEATGIIDEEKRLQLDQSLPLTGPKRVRVIVLYADDEKPDEGEWLCAAARNPAFADLADSAEDIYSPDDGEPFVDQV